MLGLITGEQKNVQVEEPRRLNHCPSSTSAGADEFFDPTGGKEVPADYSLAKYN
jgi:hypothetical protein